SWSELLGGLLTAFGLLGPTGPALMLSVMIVAAVTVHLPNGLFAATNGIEVPLLYGIGAAALALTGPGALSLDALLGLSPVFTPVVNAGALVAAVLGGAANLALRQKPAAQALAA